MQRITTHKKIDMDSHSRSVHKFAMKHEKKVEKVMREYKHGKLHSGSKKGPQVKSRAQAIAIALNEARNK